MPTQTISKRVPWILALGMFVIGTTSLSILGLGPALTRDLATDPADAGWLVTAFAATFALAAPLAQFALGQRLAPRTLILAGASILAASLVWSALASSFQALLIARIASALGGALIAPTSAALAISLVPADRRGAVLATVFAGFTLATVGGVPVATWLTLLLGWRGAIAAIGLAAVLFVALAAIYMPRNADTANAPRKRPSESFPLLAPALLLAGTVGMLSAQFVIYALMGELLGQQFGVSASGLPIAILLFGVLGVAGNAAAGALSDRVGPGPLVWASFGGLAAFLFLMFLDLGPYLGAMALAGCAFMGTLFATPQQSRLVGLVAQEHHGFVLALNSSASYLGIAVGSASANALAINTGLWALPIGALGLLALTAVVTVAFGSFSRSERVRAKRKS
ncbi:MFS transporter, DHA1 family, inner membrane transport protein [Marivita hallyeonensis]|uniref:MFS transporter, DHA1 family, inner membrane transport protein n=2 Tax=Marivita hallyeonensis TaxID=996342 RepID=A0A1M5TY45_9RHOB|nr:MFS transporter, DHA1 family, inner membrane transport protein [Marivita hallyeonensis]